MYSVAAALPSRWIAGQEAHHLEEPNIRRHCYRARIEATWPDDANPGRGPWDYDGSPLLTVMVDPETRDARPWHNVRNGGVVRRGEELKQSPPTTTTTTGIYGNECELVSNECTCSRYRLRRMYNACIQIGQHSLPVDTRLDYVWLSRDLGGAICVKLDSEIKRRARTEVSFRRGRPVHAPGLNGDMSQRDPIEPQHHAMDYRDKLRCDFLRKFVVNKSACGSVQVRELGIPRMNP